MKPRNNIIVNPVTPKDGQSCELCLRRSDKYNGWSNYETWAVALWLDNEQSTYEHWRDLAAGMLDHAKDHHEKWNTPKEQATCRLSERLKDDIRGEMPDVGPSMYSDLLGAALGSVNWYEIAEHYVEEA